MPILALSLWQPWAWLVVNGYKLIENRPWHTYVRGTILIHASQTFDVQAYLHMTDHPDNYVRKAVEAMSEQIDTIRRTRGVIIGQVDIVGCVAESKSPWFTGPWGFVLANPKAYPDPTPCRGYQRFFYPRWAAAKRVEVIDASNLPAPR